MKSRIPVIAVVFISVLTSSLSAQKAPAPGELATAVLTGNISLIDTLLVKGANPDQPDSRGQTALIYAVQSGRYELTRKILDSNADPDLPGADNLTPLMKSVKMSRDDLVVLLLSRGADPDTIIDIRNGGPVSALSLAIDRGEFDMARMLFEHGANPFLLADPSPGAYNPLKLPSLLIPLDAGIWWNTAEVKNRALSPDWDAAARAGNEKWILHRTARDNQWRLVRDEIDAGRDPDTRDSAGVTPLMTASWHGHDSIVSLLLQRGADPTIRDDSGRDALAYASAGGRSGTVDRLLSALEIPEYNLVLQDGLLENSPYYFAVSARSRRILNSLLNAGVSTSGRDREGTTLLMMAAWAGDSYAVSKLVPFSEGRIDDAGRSALDWSLAAFDRDRRTGREVGDPDRGAANYPVVRILAGRMRNPLLYSTQPAVDTHPAVIESWSPTLNPESAQEWRLLRPAPVPLKPGDGDLVLYRILRDEEPGTLSP